MRNTLFALLYISLGVWLATVAEIKPSEASSALCETVYLTGTLKLSRNAVTVESVVCRKNGAWQLPFGIN